LTQGEVFRFGIRAGIKRRSFDSFDQNSKIIKIDEPSPLTNLPPEIWFNILTKLDPSSLTALSIVNKEFNQLSSDNLIWRKLFRKEYPGRYGIMIRDISRHKNLLKKVSWKDSFNAESKIKIKLKWTSKMCDHCRYPDIIPRLIIPLFPLKG
jgi:hypothetical protein